MEGDRGLQQPDQSAKAFQSTPSVWRETRRTHVARQIFPISIHSLRVEGDFNSKGDDRLYNAISIHSLRVEGDDIGGYIMMICARISIHSLRVEGDSVKSTISNFSDISIHSLRVEGDR